MSTSTKILALAVAAACAAAPALAQREGEGGGRRMQGGGINYAPQPGVFVVVSTDSYAQTVRLKGADGQTADVFVNSNVYDLSKLKPGDRVQVNFLEPDGMNNRLAAANIWPVK
ncbi:MAG TPA: hypothetical protein VMK32_05740 [Burkholderiaceae bacterium]|nr:hypothetical protein [Burkholderiaceae bacterium]